MADKFFHFGQHVINWVFGILFGLTTIFALTSANLIVGDNYVTGAGTTMVTAVLIIIIVACAIGLYAYPSFAARCRWLFVQHGRQTASVMLALVVLWQIVFVHYIHPPIGWDAGALHQALTDTTSSNMRGYFSQNFNNVPVVLAMHWFAQLLHSTSWLTFDYITLVLVDLSALFNLLTVAVISRRHVTIAMYVHAVWLAWFPTIIVPYTDAWVLPLVSLMLLGYVVLVRGPGRWQWRLLAVIPLMGATVAAYFIKPSAIVPVVAIAAVEFLFAFKRGRRVAWTQLGVTLAVIAVVGAGSYKALDTAISRQDYIQITPGREIPAVHFISMGVSGEGGYNAKDALAMAVLPTKQARSDYSIKKLKQRLAKMGPLGYARFLFLKHRNDTADGTFAWDKEGHFLNVNPKPTPGPGIKNHLQQFVYLYGTNLGDFRWVSQLIWVIGLLLIAFAWNDQRRFIQVLRVAIIGSFLYLLMFEGGRSRYLIQSLPPILLLITFTAETSVARWRRLFAWGAVATDDE